MTLRVAARALAALALLALPIAACPDHGGHDGAAAPVRDWRAERVEAASDAWRAVDGDTLAQGRLRIRLHGIDAPELRQTCREAARQLPCGEMARQQLERLLRGAPALSCRVLSRDRYGRGVARCTRSDGVEIGRAMVRQGWALPYLAYGGEVYAADQRRARADRQGLHRMGFEAPEAYRRRLRSGGGG